MFSKLVQAISNCESKESNRKWKELFHALRNIKKNKEIARLFESPGTLPTQVNTRLLFMKRYEDLVALMFVSRLTWDLKQRWI